jgi:hypothetical protein
LGKNSILTNYINLPDTSAIALHCN